jgi:hypothetical protein
MTMTYYTGIEGTVKFDAAGEAASEITAVRSWSIDIVKDTIKTTQVGGSSETYVGGLVSGSGKIGLIYTGNNNSFLTSVTDPYDYGNALFELYINKETNVRIVFKGLITSASYGSNPDEALIIDCSFITSGDITLEV